MKKTRILFASLLTTSLVPVFVASACAKKEEEAIPESITLTYGDDLTADITIEENQTLEFKTQVFPKNAKQDVVFESSNQSAAVIEGNKLIPKGLGKTNITAHPVGYPGLKANGVNVTITNTPDITKVDESNVINDGRLIGGLSGTYGIVLQNFKVDFKISDELWYSDYHTLTAKIDWVSSESMEDDAAGITNIKVDSFNNSTFSTVCSFKPTVAIKVGHVFKFKLIFYVDYDFETGQPAATIYGAKTYSITYDGENDYEIDDSDVIPTIDFNSGDNTFAIIRGYKAPFYFGEGRPLNLTATVSEAFPISVDDDSFEIMNKVEADGSTTFDLGIHAIYPVKQFNEIPDQTITFFLNGIDVLISSGYTISKTDFINISKLVYSLEDDDTNSKLVIEGAEANFDFSKGELTLQYSMGDSQYPDPSRYDISIINNKTFNIEFYWDTLLPKFEQTTLFLKFFYQGKHLVNDEALVIVNLDDEKFIRFDGDHTTKIGYDSSSKKYFTKASTFSYGPNVSLGEGGDNLEFKLKDQMNEEITTTFSLDQRVYEATRKNVFSLLMYWDQKPELEKMVYLDVSYQGEKKISNLQLSFVDPDPENFYTVNASSNVGSIEVLNNKQNETIELGINVNLAENELIGLDFQMDGGVGNTFYDQLYSYEYNDDTSSPYKILVHIQPDVDIGLGRHVSITECDTITLAALFESGQSNVINLSSEGTADSPLGKMSSFQTQDKVTIYPNTTYYIKASFENWSYLQQLREHSGRIDTLLFVCGENLSSSYETYTPISGQFLVFCNCYGMTTMNYTSKGMNLVSLPLSYKQQMENIIWSSQVTFVWTPDFASPINIDLGVATSKYV